METGQSRDLTNFVTRFCVIWISVICVVLTDGPYAFAKSNPTPSEASALYEDALSRLNAGDAAGAAVQLKNALQQENGHLPARIALGKANLQLGDAVSAEKELKIALGLGASPEQVFPTLGNALLAQRKYQEILNLIRSKDPAFEGGLEILTLRGRAFYELGKLADAKRSYTLAHEAAPTQPEPLIGLTQVALAEGALDEALAKVGRALEVAPDNVEAWYRRGEVLQSRGELNLAMEAFNQALSRNKNMMRARLARASLYAGMANFKAAQADAEYVVEAHPNDINATFLLWKILQQSGDSKAADETLAKVTARLSEFKDTAINKEPMLLSIAAMVSFAKRDLAKTEKYLENYVALRPNDIPMRRLQGRVKLLLGDAKAAIDSLYPLYKRDPNDPEILAALGQAYLQIGHYGEASSVLENALKIAPNEPQLVSQLALSQLGGGEVQQAIGALRGAFSDKPGNSAPALLLTVLQFRNGDREEALKTVETYCTAQPKDPRGLNVLGIVQAGTGDLAGARQTLEKASALAPDFLAPQYNLAKFDLAEGKADEAVKRLEAIVERNPRADQALLLLADIASVREDSESAARWLDKAVAAVPDAINAQVRLVELRLSLKQDAEALSAARRLVERNPENALAVETLANVQAAREDKDKAKSNYRSAARYAGYDGDQLMRIARHQVTLEDYDEARRTLTKAMNSAASNQATAALIRLDIHLGAYDAATKRIAELAAAEPDNAFTDLLTGEVHFRQKDYARAREAFEAAQQKAPSTQGLIGLADSLLASGESEQAVQLLEAWTTQNPADFQAAKKLALLYLPLQQLDKAKALHERLLQTAPDDPVLLANLARIYQLEDDSRAQSVAEKALANAPNWPVALDTLGWILVRNEDTQKGLEFLREAISREDNPLTRFHLAQALNELGRTDEAKVELRTIISGGSPSNLVQDAQRKLDELTEQQHRED
jgi:cellulose synthase operon protein C